MAQTAKLFWSGRSQAVRLPKEFRLAGDEVRIRSKQGAAVILEPIATDWQWLDDICRQVLGRLLAERPQPTRAAAGTRHGPGIRKREQAA